MDNKTLNIAYTQLNEILKYISLEEFNKLPDELLENIRLHVDSNYIFKYNPQKSLKDQNVLEETKAMFEVLYRDYWATSEEKKKILEDEKYAREKLNEKKRTNYNPDNIFKNKDNKS